MKDWPQERLEAYIARHYPAYWLKVDLPHKIEHANFVRATEDADKRLATSISFDAERAVTELTLLAPDHPWLLSIIAGACALAGANIVDAQIYTTTDGRALDTISLSREFDRDEDEERRAASHCRLDRKALRGELRLPDVVTTRAPPKGRIRAFAVEPSVTIDNQWSHRYTMVEVTGLDRTGLLYELNSDTVEAQPQHCLRAVRNFQRARRRHVLRERSDGPAERLADPASGNQARFGRPFYVHGPDERGKGRQRRGQHKHLVSTPFPA